MKKFGFTLSEILIAMSVIGIIAAITFSLIPNITPDKDKAAVLKVYNALYDANNDIFSNPSLYNKLGDTSCTSTLIHVLKCTNKPLDISENPRHNTADYQNAAKYPHLLAEQLEMSKNITVSSGTYSFTTSDNIDWKLTPKPSATAFTSYEIVINTGNTKRDNCIYNKSSCTNPRQFRFKVNEDGVLSADDNLTRAYLMTPDKLNNRSEDLNKAKSLP